MSETRSTAAATVDPPKGQRSRLSGRVVPYSVSADIGGFSEEFSRGAFRESLEVTPNVPLLMFHDDKVAPVGVATGWDDRRDGLHGTFRLDSSPRAQEAARLVQNGYLAFLSVRFMPVDSEWSRDYTHVVRRRARLLEVSLVSTPAYALATVTEVRHTDRMSELCRDLGAPAMRSAVTGDAQQMSTAAELVRLVIEEHGTRAAAELDEIAAATTDPTLALNLARAAVVLDDAPDGARRIHVDHWRAEADRLRGRPRPTPVVTPRRRR